MADKIEGYLEVGLNDANEVIINHRDLKPDEFGVGHIVFSPDQARNLARLLLKHAGEADNNRDMADTAARLAQPVPPVDRSARVLMSGAPVPEDDSHTRIKENGQQQDYIVLTAEERSKGFVRPVRLAYIHVGRPPLIDDNSGMDSRYKEADYSRFKYPIRSGVKPFPGGCLTRTSMPQSIAETYARDPGFYGGTMCVSCREHFPLDQFIWEGTTDRVGS